MIDAVASLPLLTRAVVIGVLGGIGLILTQIFSRRGPLIFPVYASILAALAFVTARFPTVSYSAGFVAVLAGMLVATVIALTSVIVRARKHRERLLASGRTIDLTARPPRWALPLTALSIVVSSAAVAFVAT